MRFIEGVAIEGCDRKKGAKEEFVKALQGHAHDFFRSGVGVDAGHAFFRGEVAQEAVPGKSDGEKRPVEDVAESDDEPPPLPKKAKPCSSSDIAAQPRIIDLEESEDEAPNPKKQGQKKRKVNVIDAKASLFTTVAEAITSNRFWPSCSGHNRTPMLMIVIGPRVYVSCLVSHL